MAKELRIEVGRTLKSLQKEFRKQAAQLQNENLHSEYIKMDNWSEEQKEQRRKKQNREAAQRSRIKKMEMVWGLVQGIQELYRANWAFQQQAQSLQKHAAVVQQLQKESEELRKANDTLKTQLRQQAQVKQEPGSPEKQGGPPAASQGVAGADCEEFKVDPTQKPGAQTNDDHDVQELLSSLDEMLKMSIDSVLGFERFPGQGQAQGQALPQVDENQWISGFSQSASPAPGGYQAPTGY